ncbi:hypothetical protein [Hyphococcus sp.]|jgi:hypothetical protein|uniref:hypothetical protein n=1 Tax=Hyphococcus sp. TaxID=2038636 RepID=UPI003D0C3C28
MMMTEKELTALATLLRLAREERAALAEDLDDLLAASEAAERSLALSSIAPAVPAGDNGARRRRILAMLATYEEAEAAAREKLMAATERALQLEALMSQSGTEKLFGAARPKLAAACSII